MLELMKFSSAPYAGVLMLFWGLNVFLAGVSQVFQKKPWSCHFDHLAYWCLASILVLFAVLRPFGIAPDDLAYLDIYKGICPTESCRLLIQGERDWGWYSLIGLLKSVWDSPRILLVVAGVSAGIKLWVIFKLSYRPLWALLCFVPIFYLVQDLTALRVSLSLAFFMLAIYWLSQSNRIIGCLTVFVPGFIHLQAVVSPIILAAKMLNKHYLLFIILASIPVVLVLTGFSPMLYKQEITSWEVLPSFPVLKRVISSYIAMTNADGYQNIHVLPYSYVPFVLLIFCFSIDVFKTNRDLYIYCAMSFLIACCSLWVFSKWQEPQVRFFEFFSLPAVLLVGNFRGGLISFLSTVIVSAVFVVRYDWLHPFFLG